MAKFEFRLQRLMEYRELLEQWAKDAYLEARAARLEAEAVFEVIGEQRKKLCAANTQTLQDRCAWERLMEKLDEDERQQHAIVDLLQQEEEAKRAEWFEKRRELEMIAKLREEALEEWKQEESRNEQKALDDWSSMRRAA